MKIAKFILYVTGGLFTVYFIFDLFTHKYLPDCQFNFLVGKPGSGKSTFLCKLATEAFKAHKHVFSSEPISVSFRNKKHEKITLSTVQINPKALYRYSFPPGSVVLIDEIGVLFNNRRFKEFDPRLTEHFKRYRHDHVTYWCCSQNLDADKQIRDIVTQYWMLNKVFRIWSVARRLVCTPVVVHPSNDSPASIQDDFKEDPKLMRPILGGMKVCYLPHWVKMFDSFYIPESQRAARDIDFSQLPVPYPYQHRRLRKRSVEQ